jgi:aryl-alcohol dehydrogenase-like predicted oxidoreductase
MEYRRFGRTGLEVSAIGFGCWEIGGTYGRIDETQFRLAVQQAIEGGINCFDTAEAYGMGVSEQALGQALGGRRRDVVIVTKFGVGYADRPTRRDSSRGRVVASIEKSLQNLKTDYVDVYLVHWPDPDTPIEETMWVLDHIVRGQGALRRRRTSASRRSRPCMRKAARRGRAIWLEQRSTGACRPRSFHTARPSRSAMAYGSLAYGPLTAPPFTTA